MQVEPIEFWIAGLPKPGGSKKGFFNPKLKRVMIVDASDNAGWRQNCAFFAGMAWDGRPLLDCPLLVEITFVLPRPGSHFRTNGQLKPAAPYYHTNTPDVLKLARSTEDALSGVVWRDDKQIAQERLAKIYGDKPGAWVRVSVLEHKTPVRGAVRPEEMAGTLFAEGSVTA